MSSPFQLIAECEQVKTERETELINEQVLIAMSEMGLDRERTLQVGHKYVADFTDVFKLSALPFVKSHLSNLFFLSCFLPL